VQRSLEKAARALKMQRVAFAKVQCLQRVYKKIHLKEFYLVEQGLYKLKSKKKNSDLKEIEIALHSLAVESLITLKLPLANLFFNPFFFLLPNLLSSNTP